MASIGAQLEKVYDPKSVEEKWYARWEEGGYFEAKGGPALKPFSIVIPPPNVTGSLHMGHALNNTLQDVLVRWKRMQGLRHAVASGNRPRGDRDARSVEEHLRKAERA